MKNQFLPLKHHIAIAIAPGLQMRIKALHSFSAFLPQVECSEPQAFIGNTTASCIMTGVYYGIIDECNGLIARYKEHYEDITVYYYPRTICLIYLRLRLSVEKIKERILKK